MLFEFVFLALILLNAVLFKHPPEQSLEMSQYKPKENAVNVTCSARGVYPEPKLALYWSGGDGELSENGRAAVYPLEGVKTRATLRGDAYDVVASKLLQDGELPSPTIFDCQLMIAEADYIVRKSIVYYPNGSGPALSSGCRSFSMGSSGIRIAVALAAVVCIPMALSNLFLHIPASRPWSAHASLLAHWSRGLKGPPDSPALQRRDHPSPLPSGESRGP